MGGAPLAFVEGDIKSRIKNILGYQKPALWIGAGCTVLVIVLLASLAVNPRQPDLQSVEQLVHDANRVYDVDDDQIFTYGEREVPLSSGGYYNELRISSMAQDDGAGAPRAVEFIVVRQSGRCLVESYRYPEDQSWIL